MRITAILLLLTAVFAEQTIWTQIMLVAGPRVSLEDDYDRPAFDCPPAYYHSSGVNGRPAGRFSWSFDLKGPRGAATGNCADGQLSRSGQDAVVATAAEIAKKHGDAIQAADRAGTLRLRVTEDQAVRASFTAFAAALLPPRAVPLTLHTAGKDVDPLGHNSAMPCPAFEKDLWAKVTGSAAYRAAVQTAGPAAAAAGMASVPASGSAPRALGLLTVANRYSARFHAAKTPPSEDEGAAVALQTALRQLYPALAAAGPELRALEYGAGAAYLAAHLRDAWAGARGAAALLHSVEVTALEPWEAAWALAALVGEPADWPAPASWAAIEIVEVDGVLRARVSQNGAVLTDTPLLDLVDRVDDAAAEARVIREGMLC